MANPPKYLSEKQAFNEHLRRLIDLKQEAKSASEQVRQIAADFEQVKDSPQLIRENVKYIDNKKQKSKSLTNQIAALSTTASAAVSNIDLLHKKTTELVEASESDSKKIASLIAEAQKAEESADLIKKRIDDLNKEIRN